MKKMLYVLLLSALVAGCSSGQKQTNAGEDRAEILREKILSGDTTSVLVVAHRGDWRYG